MVDMAQTRPINVLAIVTGAERYVFLYDDQPDSVAALMRTIGQYAADQDLSFSWYDAAALYFRIALRKGEYS